MENPDIKKKGSSEFYFAIEGERNDQPESFHEFLSSEYCRDEACKYGQQTNCDESGGWNFQIFSYLCNIKSKTFHYNGHACQQSTDKASTRVIVPAKQSYRSKQDQQPSDKSLRY